MMVMVMEMFCILTTSMSISAYDVIVQFHEMVSLMEMGKGHTGSISNSK